MNHQHHDVNIEEELTCPICHDLFFQATTLVPCGHTFCGHCISKTFSRNQVQCPYCRIHVQQVDKNVTLDSLITSYLRWHPDRELTAEEKELYERQNTITYGKGVKTTPNQSLSHANFINVASYLHYGGT